MSDNYQGQPPAGEPAPGQVFCPHCNGGNPESATNCMWCGRPMATNPATTTPIADPVPAQVYDAQPQSYQQPPAPAPHAGQPAQPPPFTQEPYSQPAPVVATPAAAPKSGSGMKIALIVGGVLLGLLLLCGVLFGSIIMGVLGLTQPAVDAGNNFMTALRDDNYDRAFELCAPSLQEEVGNAQALEDALSSKQPVTWSINSRNIEGDLATLEGTTTYAGDEPGTLEMELRKVCNDWRVSFINLR